MTSLPAAPSNVIFKVMPPSAHSPPRRACRRQRLCKRRSPRRKAITSRPECQGCVGLGNVCTHSYSEEARDRPFSSWLLGCRGTEEPFDRAKPCLLRPKLVGLIPTRSATLASSATPSHCARFRSVRGGCSRRREARCPMEQHGARRLRFVATRIDQERLLGGWPPMFDFRLMSQLQFDVASVPGAHAWISVFPLVPGPPSTAQGRCLSKCQRRHQIRGTDSCTSEWLSCLL